MFLKYLFFGVFLVFQVKGQTCKSCESVTSGFPCYTDDDIFNWVQAVRENGCSYNSTDDQIRQFYDCVMNIAPDYITNVVENVMKPDLQCGERLASNTGLTDDSSLLDGLAAFCRNPPGREDTTSFKLLSCSLYEYARKFSAMGKQDYNNIQCPANNPSFGNVNAGQSA